MKFVNVYEIDRRWGGPEEGGWWYNNYNCIETQEVPEEKAEEVVEQLEEKYKDRIYGDIYSVLGGRDIAVYIEDERAESETKERPYYE